VLEARFDDDATALHDLCHFRRTFLLKLQHLRRKHQCLLEYFWIIEVGEADVPHLHLLICEEVGLTRRQIRALWSDACGGRPVKVYFEPTYSVPGTARYVVKDLKGHVVNPDMLLKDYRGRLWGKSKGFLTKPGEELWQECLREWYPEQDHDGPAGKPVMLSPDLDSSLNRAPVKHSHTIHLA
jgi:hypothetical protein